MLIPDVQGDNLIVFQVTEGQPVEEAIVSIQAVLPDLLREVTFAVEDLKVRQDSDRTEVRIMLDGSLTEDAGCVLQSALDYIFRQQESKPRSGMFRKPLSRRKLIDQVRDALSEASARLAEAESVHIQLVTATEQLLKMLDDGRDPIRAMAEVRGVLEQERDKR